jgi:hypothetical protein
MEIPNRAAIKRISRRVREAERSALGINQSFQNLAFQQPHFYLGGKPERRTLGMCKVFNSNPACGQGEIPGFLHRARQNCQESCIDNRMG